jgi:hypothetical protein
MEIRMAVVKILTLNCEDATFLASESLDRPLTIDESIAAGMHSLICPGCRRFTRQVRFLSEAARRFALAKGADGTSDLPAEAREKIRETLREEPPD